MRTAAALLLLLAGLAPVAHALADGAPDAAAAAPVLPGLSGDEAGSGSLADLFGLPLQIAGLRLGFVADAASARADLAGPRAAAPRAASLLPGLAPGQGRGALRLKVALPLHAGWAKATGLDLVPRGRAGTAPTLAGAGTSAFGHGLRLELQRPLAGWNAFGHLGWRRSGELPGTSAGRAALAGEVGASRLITPRLEAGALLDLRPRMPTANALPQASLYGALQDGDRRWEFFVGRSFDRPGGDIAAGVVLRTGF